VTDIAKLPTTPSPVGQKPTDPRLAAKARELEGVLLGQFVQLMLKDVDAGSVTGGGEAEGQWKDLLAQEYGKAIADGGGIGLAVQIERELQAAMAGGAHHPASLRTETNHDD
jgi:Rod binding domain-containing protein